GLHLSHDVSSHADKDIVIGTGGKMIFEAGAADPANFSIDDQDLAVVRLPYLILAEGKVAIRQRAVFLQREDVVDNDLDSTIDRLVEQRLVLAKHLRAIAIDR